MKKTTTVLPAFVWYSRLGFRTPKGICTALAYSNNRFSLLFEPGFARGSKKSGWLPFDEIMGVPEALAWFALARVVHAPVPLENLVVSALKASTPGFDNWLHYWGKSA